MKILVWRDKRWKLAYKDIIPQSYLESIPAGRWVTKWKRTERASVLLFY